MTEVSSARSLAVAIVFATFPGLASPGVAAEPALLWDEAVDGDLPGVYGEPRIFPITSRGEYRLRATTGPMLPMRRSGPPVLPEPLRAAITRLDDDGDGTLDAGEVRANFRYHFELYDLDGDGRLAADEIAQFEMGGDGHDLFTFEMADGIQLVAIRVLDYQAGGPRNEASIFAVIDERGGKPEEARGVEIAEVARQDHKPFGGSMVAGLAVPGSEIYAQFDLWEAYRRNDSTNYFRLGEGQEQATTELVFVFD